MYVLGINSYLHDSSAALFRDGKLVFAAEEERLSRIKKDARFPQLAIKAALSDAGISFEQLDGVAFGWNKAAVTPIHTLRSSLTNKLPISAAYVGYSLLTIGREIYHGNGRRSLDRAFGRHANVPVLFINHHASHAWSSYALSGMEEALVIVMDGRGARESTTLYHARGEELKLVKKFDYPNSLGSFYEGFTDLLGFERQNDEWKVMGLAAYGEPTYDLSDMLRVTEHGYDLDAHLICGNTWGDISRLTQRFGPRRNPEVFISQDDMNLAASVQKAVEEAIFSVVREGIRLTGCTNVCLAGGVAMNSKANGRLLSSGLVKDLFVQPAATDDGAAIGAAIAAHKELGHPVPRYRLNDLYVGPEFSNSEIADTIGTFKLPGIQVQNVETVVAGLLAQGNIVGWFQGAMEFGPRALGNRSILADARRPDMKDRVNECVKFREGWRPFAPSCLEEAASEYFEGCTEAPYMILTFDVVEDKRAVIPAVTHADNTARVQTVSQSANPRYHRLIKEFASVTGVPVIMNTSFNLRGEPIVCTPKDAVRTFYSSGLDFLVMGDYIVAKDPAWRPAQLEATAGSR
ncbi:MAG TPA: carbamoyltransferase C-terminal domain-containing protein [Dehalococcoidia bacterium]|nr:carbamoyltransferase C-terminal domain-containing protein [Dehalococcoidia bacterium]